MMKFASWRTQPMSDDPREYCFCMLGKYSVGDSVTAR